MTLRNPVIHDEARHTASLHGLPGQARHDEEDADRFAKIML
jgi:hypothetical protein